MHEILKIENKIYTIKNVFFLIFVKFISVLHVKREMTVS